MLPRSVDVDGLARLTGNQANTETDVVVSYLAEEMEAAW
jgi:hypothetical protein